MLTHSLAETWSARVSRLCVCGGGGDSHPLRGEDNDEGNRGRTVGGGDQEGAVSGMKSE